jgi:biopolymer transport protein ExbD
MFAAAFAEPALLSILETNCCARQRSLLHDRGVVMAFATDTSGQQSEINVTPLIDVLLVLLIIFMVIVPVMPHGLESQVPQRSKATQPTVAPVSVQLLGDEAGKNLRYEVDGQAVDRGRLSEALLAKLRVRPERSVYVAAGANVSYQFVAEAVGAAKAAGATTVGLGRLVPGS